ncbi:peptidylprolyl isomerase [Thermodesulfobacteriota bacterium]
MRFMMIKLTLVISLSLSLFASSVMADSINPVVRIETTLGIIKLELDYQEAPKTVNNFLSYMNDKFYDGTIFHRVIKNFMIQGGGLKADMSKKPTKSPIINEADNGLKNLRGTIAMARTSDPHSATAQFFINLKKNSNLDHRGKNTQTWGYCVFGKVIEGMDIVDTIAQSRTTIKGQRRDVPVSPIVIKNVTQEN